MSDASVMDIEWVRLITITLSVSAVIILSWLYMKKRQPIILSGIAWLLLVLLYSIFKILVDGDLNYYELSTVWTAFIYSYGAVLLILIGLAFRDLK